MNLLIFKFVNLGDNVVFLPVVQTLRARFPNWRITLLTTPQEAGLYASVLTPREIITCPQLRFNSSWKRPWEFATWWARVRLKHPNACLISFDQGNAAHLLARHSGANVRVGARIAHVRINSSLTHDVRMPADGRVASWHWEMARVLVQSMGHEDWPASPPPPDLSGLVIPFPRTRARRIVIHAGSNQAFTRWPLERFAEVATRLASTHEVVWVNRPETSTVPLPAAVHRSTPKSLQELTSLLASADLFLGNNSGPMHLANALGVRGVVVSGPTAHGWDPFWYRERWTVLRNSSLFCVPCEWTRQFRLIRDCALTTAPLACLHHWTPDIVEAACRTRLALTP